MVDQVTDELRNTKIESKILRWLNLATIRVASQYVFGHLHKYYTKSITGNNPDVVLDSDFLWLKSAILEADNKTLVPRDESELKFRYPKYRTQTGTVDNYYLNGKILSTFMVSPINKTLSGAYQRRPVKITLSVDCDLPDEWHELICIRAIKMGYRYDRKDIPVSLIEEERMCLRSVEPGIQKRPDELLIMGINATPVGKPGRPRFPSNYPKIGF